MVGENGKIVFKASRDTLLEAGSVTSATGAGRGGEIQVLGDRVGLTGDAKVDASGVSGGGTVLVGGDYHGGNEAIQNATQTFVGRDTAIKADALQSGAGGKVIVWSDQATRAYGSLSARGGALGGNGGFVETSGHYLDVAGIAVNTSAPTGKFGTWLLDPFDIVVAIGGNATLADVSLFATPPSTGTTTIAPATISSANSDVALQATHDITFTDAVNIAATNVGLTARAGNDIKVNNTIATNGGAILLFANDSGGPSTGTGMVTTTGAITSNGGGIGLSGKSLNIGGSITSFNGMIDMKSADFLSIDGGGVNAGAGNITLLAGAQIDVWSGSTLSANQLKMTATGGITNGSGGAVFTQVSALNAGNSGTGDIRIDNSSGGNLSIIDIGSTGYGIHQVTGGIVDILNLGGTLSGNGLVSGGDLSLHASGGIALQTKVSSLSAFNYTSGDINIKNSIPLKLNDVKQLAEVGVNSGSIIIDNTGALTLAAGSTVSAASGGIALTAHSPLTVDGAVVTTSGPITLTAGATGIPGAGDTLTINGSVSSTSGNISLRAGDAINIAANAVVATGSSVTQAPNLNGLPLPPLSQCLADPALSGCSSVLPTISACTATPALPGCSAVLPTLATCITNPSAAGCTAVLPTLATCIANTSAIGCTAVLPTLATCITNPNAGGCTVVLPTLATCVAHPSAAGCSAVLPTWATCVANPTTAGCAAVLPTVNQCAATPMASGCLAVLPPTQITSSAPVVQAMNTTVNIINTSTATVATSSTAGKIADTPTAAPKTDEKKADQKDTAVIEKTGAKNEPVKKMYCN